MILVTGSAGFIGFHLSKRLLEEGEEVVGIDNLNDYYEVRLKKDRNEILKGYDNYKFHKIDISEKSELEKIFKKYKIDKVCNLAAQAGVRYSIEHPYAYGKSNLIGFLNVLHLSKDYEVKNFVYASSSSVYGGNTNYPYSEEDRVDTPVSLYAATKKSNELMAYSYYDLYDFSSIGLRFFTVYGPWGRPDMAYFKFAKLMVDGKSIDVYNHGKMERDFTYVDDVVNGIVEALGLEEGYGCEVLNIGKGSPDKLMDMIKYIEEGLGIEADKNFMGMQKGDVLKTWADTTKIEDLLGYKPKVGLEEGLKRFVGWFKGYYEV